MLRNLCKLRKNILMARVIYSRHAVKAGITTNSTKHTKSDESLSRGITVTDINVIDLARGDLEFQRNFLTSLSGLQTNGIMDMLSTATSSDAGTTPDPEPSGAVETPAADNVVSDNPILGNDGQPIVAIEIDGWKNAEGDEDEYGPTVQNPGESIAIGDDEEYKNDNELVVPAKRQGQVEYKGIKVKMPEKASRDIGTYRFRRNKEDLENVGDDMRLVKFDK